MQVLLVNSRDLDGQNFLIRIPYKKYKYIFKCDNFIEVLLKIILIPLGLAVFVIDILKLVFMVITIGPIVLLKSVSESISDIRNSFNPDNPIMLLLWFLTVPFLLLNWIYMWTATIVYPIVGVIVYLSHIVELILYKIYVIMQERSKIIPNRPFLITTNEYSYRYTSFSRTVLGGKTYGKVYHKDRINDMGEFISILNVNK